ncbi:hypothetical protein TI03_03465 [Achromatium sp. WMS1]|nr:hypothetical protein TI03_03465 [Achromatium sp. WMS1]
MVVSLSHLRLLGDLTSIKHADSKKDHNTHILLPLVIQLLMLLRRHCKQHMVERLCLQEVVVQLVC